MDSPLKRPTYPFKIKPFTEKELMKMEKKTKPKARPTMLNSRRLKLNPTPTKKLPKVIKGNDAIREFQKQISPSGMAKTKRQQTKAQDDLMVKRYGKKK